MESTEVISFPTKSSLEVQAKNVLLDPEELTLGSMRTPLPQQCTGFAMGDNLSNLFIKKELPKRPKQIQPYLPSSAVTPTESKSSSSALTLNGNKYIFRHSCHVLLYLSTAVISYYGM